jgi:hypothetical protein
LFRFPKRPPPAGFEPKSPPVVVDAGGAPAGVVLPNAEKVGFEAGVVDPAGCGADVLVPPNEKELVVGAG